MSSNSTSGSPRLVFWQTPPNPAQKLLPEPADVEEDDVPKLQTERKRIESLLGQAAKLKAQPFAGPDTLLDVARKRAGLPIP